MDSIVDRTSSEPLEAPAWRPISAIDRRVAGVIVEKAKTVPASYPMTVNAICTGANQKNNRDPEMNLTPDDVQESLDRLREMGAVGEVQGDGRALKYRHYLYKWLGTEKGELAVMCELLLRGAQTVGELRSRVARMEPIADLAALKPIIDSLIKKGLVLSLSPEGRGQVVTHALYSPNELEKVKANLGIIAGRSGGGSAEPPRASGATSSIGSTSAAPSSGLAAASNALAELQATIAEMRREMSDLREEVASLKQRLDAAGA